MELVAGYPFWLLKTGLPYEYPALRDDKRCDALIIGGGISGALTAYYCIRAGIECILVDARAIGLGSTCASTSLLQYELDIPLHRLKKIVGNDNAIRSYQLCARAIDKLLELMKELNFSEYAERPSLFFSQHKKEEKFMKKEFEARKDAGFDVEVLSRGEVLSHYGLQAQAGILSQKGASLNAYRLTHEILQNGIARGLAVYDRTRVTGISEEAHGVLIETSEGFKITADYVINATGYEVTDFIGKKIVDLDCTYALISAPFDKNDRKWKDDIIMWNTDEPYLYLCIQDDNRVIMGGRDESFVKYGTMHRLLSKKTGLLEKDFEKCFPGLSLKTEFAWSGVFGKTKDSLPYIGALPKAPRTFYALGFGGNGITFSQIAAEIIADMIKGKEHPDAKIFSFSR